MARQFGSNFQALCSTAERHDVVDPGPFEGHAVQLEGAGIPGPGSSSDPSAAPTSGIGQRCSARGYLVDAARTCEKSEYAFSHTATSLTGHCATYDAHPSKRLRWLSHSSQAELFCHKPPKQAFGDGGRLPHLEQRRGLQQGA